MKMKKYLLLFVAALALGFASCSDDETIPNLTGIAIESEGGVTEVIQGGTLALTANYTSNVNPEVRWEVNGEVKSTDKEFSFTEAEPGKYYDGCRREKSKPSGHRIRQIQIWDLCSE